MPWKCIQALNSLFGAPRSARRAVPRAKPRAALEMESLEGRLVPAAHIALSGGGITITGSEKNDGAKGENEQNNPNTRPEDRGKGSPSHQGSAMTKCARNVRPRSL